MIVTNAHRWMAGLGRRFGIVIPLLAGLALSEAEPRSGECMRAPSGLVAWWRAEGDSTATIGRFESALVGETSFGLGKVGTAFRFDGAGDGILLGEAAALHLQEFSIEAWVKRGNESKASLEDSRGIIIGFGNGGYAFGLEQDGRLFLDQVGSSSIHSSFAIKDLEWHHVVVTKSSGIVIFYLDGIRSLAHQYEPTFRFVSEAMIGAWQNQGVRSSFVGQIDELSVYSRALTLQEVQNGHASGSIGKCIPPMVTITPDRNPFMGSTTVTLSSNGSGVIRFTVDGSNPAATSKVYENPFVVTNSTTVRAQLFQGEISLSQIAVAIVVRTPDTLECVPNDGLVGWWSADQNSANLMTSELGQERPGMSYAAGKVGQAFAFQESGAAVKVGSNPALHLQTFTIAAWVKRSDLSRITYGGSDGVVFGFGEGGYGIGLANDGRLFLSLLGRSAVRSRESIPDTNWHHIAITRAGRLVTFYIDGKAEPGVSYDAEFTFNSEAAIGAAGNLTASLIGLIDELRIYSRELSASEIRGLFNAEAYRRCIPADLRITPSGGVFTNSTIVTMESSDTNAVIRYTMDLTAPNELSQLYTEPIVLTGRAIIRAQAFTGSIPISDPVLAGFVLSTAATECLAPNGLVGWWSGESNSVDFVSFREGKLVGEVTYASGKVGRSFRFGQRGAALILAYSEAFHLQNFTIAAWINQADLSRASFLESNGMIFAFDHGDFGFGLNDNGQLFLSNISRSAIFSKVPVPSTGWHHVAVTRSGNAVTFYIDGVPGLAFHYDTVFTFGPNATIGSAGNLRATFNGNIDELRVYDQAILPAEIQALVSAEEYRRCVPAQLKIIPVGQEFSDSIDLSFTSDVPGAAIHYTLDGTVPSLQSPKLAGALTLTNSAFVRAQLFDREGAISALAEERFFKRGCAPILPGLIAWWPGDLAANDFVGGNHGTARGDLKLVPGKLGDAFHLDGEGDAVLVQSVPLFQQQSFTIEAWIRRSRPDLATLTSAGNGVLIGSGWGGVAFAIHDQGYLVLMKVGSGFVRSASAIPDTSWHHVAVVRSGQTAAFYLDGALDREVEFITEFAFGQNLAIGALADLTSSFAGEIDELSLYNRALTGQEITSSIRVSGKCGELPPRIAIQPSEQRVATSTTAVFQVNAGGTPPLRYQWEFNGGAIAQATNSVLVISNVTAVVEGTYRVTIVNSLGQITSEPALLKIVELPRITRGPQSQSVLAGSSTEFSVEATGEPPLTYQWFVNNQIFPGATSRMLVIPNTRFTDKAAYTVRVSNPLGFILSAPALLTVGTAQLKASINGDLLLLDVRGEAGVNLSIEVSTDLVRWTQLAAVLNAPVNWRFQDPIIGQGPHRFYRVRRD